MMKMAGGPHNPPASRRRERLEALRRIVRENPFLTDEELAGKLGVSAHTVRYDRLALGIPEVRRRTAEVAHQAYNAARGLAAEPVVGELIDIDRGRNAMSLLEATKDVAREGIGIVPEYLVFAQADSLALSVADMQPAVTSLVNVKFKRPVRIGEKLLARAEVIRRKGKKMVVLVTTRSRTEQVFRGKFVISSLENAAGGLSSRGGEDESS